MLHGMPCFANGEENNELCPQPKQADSLEEQVLAQCGVDVVQCLG